MTSRLLAWLLSRLDALVRLLARSGVSESFIRFGIIGVAGFCWDTATVYAMRRHTNLYVAGAFGFFVAATANWLFNRLWTFRDIKHEAPHIQWLKFLAANAIGFVFNRGTFFALITFFAHFAEQPVFAIAAGSASGLCFNYFLSKRLVFR